MNIEEIKVGWIYNVRLKCITREIGESLPEFSFVAVDSQGEATCDDLVYFTEYDLPAFSYPSPPVTTPPAHDPCREYRAGDKVKLKTNFGRNPYDTFDGAEYIPDDTVFTVLRDEWAGGKVDLYEKEDSDAFTVHYTNIELVTPVEEMEPFNLYMSDDNEYVITFDDLRVTTFPFNGEGHPYYYTQEQAKAAAEAERNRLNEKYRKECENV